MRPDHAALKVGVKREPEGQRALVDPALKEQSEGISASAITADCLAPLGSEPRRDVPDGLDAHPGRNLASPAPDFGTRPAVKASWRLRL